jgi:hypothetical protein
MLVMDLTLFPSGPLQELKFKGGGGSDDDDGEDHYEDA